MSQTPSYDELLATCEDLRRTAARAISVKQQLIATTEALEHERDLYVQIQRFIATALPLESVTEFATLAVESLLQAFDVEASLLLWYRAAQASSDQMPVVAGCGLQSCPPELPSPREWLQPRTPASFDAGSPLVAAWAAIAAHEVFLYPLHDLDGRIHGCLAVLRTQSGADFFEALTKEKCTAISLFCHHAEGLLRNLQAKEVIREQVLDLQQALARQHEETERRRAEEERVRQQATVIAIQRETLRQLATPIIPIRDGVLVVPLIGEVDGERAALLLETLLGGVATRRAHTLIIDITGVPTLDAEIANLLLRMTRAVNLLGATVLLSGIRADVAKRFVEVGGELASLRCVSSLQVAIAQSFLRR